MNIDALKNIVTVALNVAVALAKITASQVDDKIVAFLRSVAASESVWQIIAALFGNGPVPNPIDNGGLLLISQGDAPAAVSVSGAAADHLSHIGVSEDSLNKALAEANVKGLDIGQITLLIQLAIAIFKVIRK